MSAVHTDEDAHRVVEAFGASLLEMRQDGMF
jgi:hypothetical protein